MAYNKTTPGIITFVYAISSILDSASMQSAFMTKELATKEGKSLAENFALTEDESEVFNVSLEKITSEIFEILQKHAGSAINSYTHGATSITIALKSNASYVDNDFTLLDAAIKECLVNGSLKEWFKTCPQVELFNLANGTYANNKEVFKQRLFLLKKKRAIVL